MTFQLSCHVFFTQQCVLPFAMNLSCSITPIKGTMKKLVSRLKWHFVSWWKRFVCYPFSCVSYLYVNVMVEAPFRAQICIFWAFLICRLVSLVLILCHQPWICWPNMNVHLTVIITGRSNLERCASACWSPFHFHFILQLTSYCTHILLGNYGCETYFISTISYFNFHDLRCDTLQIDLLDFSRDRKMMSVLCSRNELHVLFSKGAPESIISRCTTILCNDDGSIVPLTADIRAELDSRFHRLDLHLSVYPCSIFFIVISWFLFMLNFK